MNDETPVRTNPEGMFTPIDFTTFMRNYQNMVFSTAVRLVGNEAQAEDISQEVFLKAYQHFDNLQTSKTAGGVAQDGDDQSIPQSPDPLS